MATFWSIRSEEYKIFLRSLHHGHPGRHPDDPPQVPQPEQCFDMLKSDIHALLGGPPCNYYYFFFFAQIVDGVPGEH